MDQYKADLAKPYMTDSIFLNSLVKEEYDRSRNEVEAYHIMILKGNTPESERLAYATADSLRSAIIGGADFGELAKKYSTDRGSYLSGGRMGWITTGRFPYAFEKMAFSLQPGEISEIVESAQAYHVLKGGRKRPARGSVLTEHIMKMCRQDATAEEEAAAKAAIDSIAKVVKADPEKFEDLARELSDDKGSGRQGGRLQWFEAGMMVEPFDSAAFEIGIGEISEPFRSQFGWHIVRKLDARGLATLDDMKPVLLQRFSSEQDERNALIRKNLIANLGKKHKGSLSKANIDMLCNGVAETGIDSVWMVNARNRATIGNIEIAKIGKKSICLADWAENAMPLNITDGETACSRLRGILENFYDNSLISTEEDWLYNNVAAYSNLLDEYRDGSLLYEASLQEVWDRAGKDTEGL
ncbi:MAG: peptidylprolyl isomerase [Muribaculaceae bacterium]|nr:peptidylprolyl isomerase [Muribaculaceae bacterium]